MSDYIVRATAANTQIRAFAASTTELVEEARKRHQTSPVATAALGRLLTAGVMMGSMMKNDSDVLTLQIQCGGEIGGMTVTADSHGDVKGYVNNPDVMLPPKNGKLDVGGALGPGFLNVIKDMGLKEPYSGQTMLQTGEIAEDLTYYFATSEQVPSSVGLGVLMEKDNTVRCAGGFIVQVMPFVDDEVLDKLEGPSFLPGCRDGQGPRTGNPPVPSFAGIPRRRHNALLPVANQATENYGGPIHTALPDVPRNPPSGSFVPGKNSQLPILPSNRSSYHLAATRPCRGP